MAHRNAIETVIDPRKRPVGNGTVRRLLPWRRRRMVGPFVFTDLIGPDALAAGVGTDIDAHPHIGLSTVTYLFDGRLVHRDSTGAVQTIEAGAVNWMTAGSGVTHTERSHPGDRPVEVRIHGLQTWVALPVDQEETEPFFEHHSATSIPAETHGSVTIRLAAGSAWGLTSPVAVSSPLVLAELRLSEGASIDIDGSHRERAVLAVEGSLRLADQDLSEARLAVLEPGARPALTGQGRAVVIGGEPVGSRHIWWNFVHSSRERIEQAKADWTAQRFPKVPGDHDPWVPLP